MNLLHLFFSLLFYFLFFIFYFLFSIFYFYICNFLTHLFLLFFSFPAYFSIFHIFLHLCTNTFWTLISFLVLIQQRGRWLYSQHFSARRITQHSGQWNRSNIILICRNKIFTEGKEERDTYHQFIISDECFQYSMTLIATACFYFPLPPSLPLSLSLSLYYSLSLSLFLFSLTPSLSVSLFHPFISCFSSWNLYYSLYIYVTRYLYHPISCYYYRVPTWEAKALYYVKLVSLLFLPK